MDGFTIFAWIVLTILFLVVVVLIVWLGSMPRKIALKRNHPQVDAINAASWIGLALGGIGWPIAFVWAFLSSGPIGSASVGSDQNVSDSSSAEEIRELKQQIGSLEKQLIAAKKATKESSQ